MAYLVLLSVIVYFVYAFVHLRSEERRLQEFSDRAQRKITETMQKLKEMS